MNGFIDTLMIILFVLFMVFIINGYHKDKTRQREASQKRMQKKSAQNDDA